MNIIILYQTNEHIFPDFYWIASTRMFLMIKIGGEIGALNTILLIFLTAIIGVYYAVNPRYPNIKVRLVNLYQNKAPVYELMSGASIAIAAVMLIFPGFLTDTLDPFVNSIHEKYLLYCFKEKENTNETKRNKNN